MSKGLDHILERLQAAGRLEDLQSIVEALPRSMEGRSLRLSLGQRRRTAIRLRNLLQRVVHPVCRERLPLRTDPVVIGCFQRAHPIDWKRLDWSSKAARTFRADSIAHGVGTQGFFSVPIRGPVGQFALFTVSADRDDAEWAEFTRANQTGSDPRGAHDQPGGARSGGPAAGGADPGAEPEGDGRADLSGHGLWPGAGGPTCWPSRSIP